MLTKKVKKRIVPPGFVTPDWVVKVEKAAFETGKMVQVASELQGQQVEALQTIARLLQQMNGHLDRLNNSAERWRNQS